jgi:hypothetical protein
MCILFLAFPPVVSQLIDKYRDILVLSLLLIMTLLHVFKCSVCLDISVYFLLLLIRAYVRFEVFTAVTMKNVVFWDIKTQFLLHRGHIASPLQSPAS